MAGLAESTDNFWSWRDRMYEIALRMKPEDLSSIGKSLYQDMLDAGYTSVAEFHYLHHDESGNRYDKISLMGQVLIDAAHEVGLEITLVPVFYQKGGFNQEAKHEQRRFLFKNVDEYQRLVEEIQSYVQERKWGKVGVGVHSLRAAGPDDIKAILSSYPDFPKHIHIAEQTQEVEDCLKNWKKRPIEWLLGETGVDDSYHLIHATHIEPSELKTLAKSGANVVLCPTTEANLGDGFFPISEYREANGSWCIGSDSQVSIDPFEELRWLDYGARLQHRKRNPLATASEPSSAEYLLRQSFRNGRRAMGSAADAYFKVGDPFNSAVIKSSVSESADSILPRSIYHLGRRALLGTLTHGQWRNKE